MTLMFIFFLYNNDIYIYIYMLVVCSRIDWCIDLWISTQLDSHLARFLERDVFKRVDKQSGWIIELPWHLWCNTSATYVLIKSIVNQEPSILIDGCMWYFSKNIFTCSHSFLRCYMKSYYNHVVLLFVYVNNIWQLIACQWRSHDV